MKVNKLFGVWQVDKHHPLSLLRDRGVKLNKK